MHNSIDALVRAAAIEKVDVDELRRQVARGEAVVLDRTAQRGGRPLAIGRRLTTKVNVNIGTSPLRSDLEGELEKLRVAVDSGADTIMDLSTGDDLEEVREAILSASPVPVGTVPIYDVLVRLGVDGMTSDGLVDTVARHAEQGVDFVTVHCGITRSNLGQVGRRVAGVVSRGGAATIAWMKRTGRENPLFERYDEVLDIAKSHEMALSLGDGLRPGALADAGDIAQLSELCQIGELVRRARDAGVKVIVEGPGHVPLDQVEAHIKTARSVTAEAPLYVLGPLVLDTAAGWDHIAAAIGGAVAASAGAAFLCYVTPAEHLGLPSLEHVRRGLIATRIAARAGDVAKGIGHLHDRERQMSQARKALDWDAMLALALDPAEAAKLVDRHESRGTQGSGCSMCGEFCSVKTDIDEC